MTVVLVVLGVFLSRQSGVLQAVGVVALAHGIGLTVALLWLVAGHNPVSRRRADR